MRVYPGVSLYYRKNIFLDNYNSSVPCYVGSHWLKDQNITILVFSVFLVYMIKSIKKVLKHTGHIRISQNTFVFLC